MSDIATKLTAIAENQQRVYDAGKQAEYDAFWDAYQNNGSKPSYQYAYAGTGWTLDKFKPKHDMTPYRCDYMFASNGMTCDLVEVLDSLGVALDLSGCTIFTAAFTWSQFTRIGKIDTRNTSSLYEFLSNSKIVTVDEIVLKDDGSTTFSNTFKNATYLENITFSGVIGQSINFQWSPLSKASFISIINALSTTTSGLTLTVSQSAVINAFGSTTADEWTALIATKSNWTISLV